MADNNGIDIDIEAIKDLTNNVKSLTSQVKSLSFIITDLNDISSKGVKDTTSGFETMHKRLKMISDDYDEIYNRSVDWRLDTEKQAKILKKLAISNPNSNLINQFNNAYKQSNNKIIANDNIDTINQYFDEFGSTLSNETKKTLNDTLDYWYKVLDEAKEYTKGTSKELDKRVRGEKAYQDALKGVNKSSQYTTKQLKEFHKAYEKQQTKDNFMNDLNDTFVGSGMGTRAILNGLGLDSLSNWATSGRADLRKANYDIFRNSQKVEEQNNLRVKGLEEKRKNAKTTQEKEEITKEIEEVNNSTKQNKEISRGAMRQNVANYALKGIDSLLKDINKKVIEGIKSITKEAVSTLKDVASYDLGNSLFVNSSARNQAMKYGLNSSQNYAFTQTSKIMGISSEEDLFYMNSNQKELFFDLMQKEQNIYSKMTENGTLEQFQEMQVDLQVLKQEFLADVVSFIVDNKDLIIGFMKNLMSMVKNIMERISAIHSFFHKNNDSSNGYASRTRSISASEMSAYRYSGTTTDNISYNTDTTNNANRNYNITINNDNKGSDNSSLAQQVSERTLTSLSTFFQS